MKWRGSYKIWLALGVVVVLVSAGATALALHTTQTKVEVNGISPQIREQTGFAIFAPKEGVKPGSVKYNTISEALSYQIDQPFPVTVSAQRTPTQFADIEGYETKFYAGLNQYETIQSRYGAVQLVRPSEQKGADVAVFNQESSLVFISSKSELTVDQWRSVIDSLELVVD